jgi:hypothetical protein
MLGVVVLKRKSLGISTGNGEGRIDVDCIGECEGVEMSALGTSPS